MKFQFEYVRSKVLKYVPHFDYANMSMPEALKTAAVDIFMRENAYPKIHVPEYDKYVIHTALKELNEIGYLTYGTIDEDWGSE